MRVPAALHRWAAEHNQQLSASTRSEVGVIASIIDASSLGGRDILDLGGDFEAGLYEIFPAERAERAATLIGVVADWAALLPAEPPRTAIAEVNPRPSIEPVVTSASADRASLTSPTFLQSDMVDEEDSARMYGSARNYLRLIAAVLSVLLLGAVGVGVWLWANSRSADTATEADSTSTEADVNTEADATPDPAATPTVTPTLTTTAATSPVRSFWADTTTVLNGGTSTIASSTYPVSPANRAVLTGHAAGITGIAVTDDGRVLTSGADSRLVDWGSDVTLARPDVLDVGAPLTSLSRTPDEKLVAGDASGNLIVVDLRAPGEPAVIGVHDEAVSAISQLPDGSVVAASVSGNVAIVDLATSTTLTTLSHDLEVTDVAVLDDATIATAAVDGVVRLWSPSGAGPLATIDSLGAPVTAVKALDDGRLAIGSVTGDVHIVAPTDQAEPELVIEGHRGAIRSLLPFVDERYGPSLASAGDDSSIRLHSLTSGEQWQQLDGHGDLVSAIAQLPDGRLVSTSGDGTGRVWDLEFVGGPIVVTPHRWNVSDIVAWRNDQFVTGGSDGLVMLASTTEPSEPELVTEHAAPIVGLTVMPNGDVVSLDAASVLKLIQVGPDAAAPLELTLAAGATSLDNRGGLGVVSGHADGTVRFSDLTSETSVVAAHASGVNDVLGLSSGLVLSAGNDATVRLVDPDNPDVLPVFDLHTEPVTALAELPDGRVASAGTDAIYVWSVTDMGADHVRLSGHRSTILTLYGLPDGRLLSTAADGRVRLWDLREPESEAEVLVDVPGVVNPHLIQADNGLLVAGAGRGYVVFTIE